MRLGMGGVADDATGDAATAFVSEMLADIRINSILDSG